MKPRPYKSVSPSTVLLMRQIIVGLMIAAFFGMLIICVWFGTRVQSLTLSTITIKGGETIPHADVEKIVQATLSGTYLKLVPRTFAFTYPEAEIIEDIKEIKRIKNLTVVRVGGTELVVEFDEYIPHALWCFHSDTEGCYFLDENGYSFSAAPPLTGGSFVRFNSIGRNPEEHVQAFSQEEYKKIHELIARFAEAKWFVQKAEVDAAGDAFLTIVDGGEFKVSLRQDTKETVDNLLTVLNSEKFSHIKPGNFEYVDLRFGEKVFVNEVTLASASTSTATSTDETLASKPLPDNEPVTETPEDTHATSSTEE